MVSDAKSSFQVWVTVTEVSEYCVEVRAVSKEEASEVVQEALENHGGRRYGVEYLMTSKGVMGFNTQDHGDIDVSVEVEEVEPLSDEESTLLDYEVVAGPADARK